MAEHVMLPDDLHFLAEREVIVGAYLGGGASGEVYQCTHNGILRAVKYLPDTEIHNEVEILELLSLPENVHNNIIGFHGSYRNPATAMNFILLEFVNGGTLEGHIGNQGLQEQDARRLFLEILLGVQHLHDLNIQHADIKTENLLRGNVLKIADFGLAARTINATGEQVQRSSDVGTEMYKAPEVNANGSPYDPKAADLFSCGCVLFKLLTGRVPFPGPSAERRKQQIRTGVRPRRTDHVSPNALALLRRLLRIKPENRCSATEALTSEWMLEGE